MCFSGECEKLQIQNVGVGEAGVVEVARSHWADAVVPCSAGSGDVDAAFGGALARAAVVIRGDDGGRPLAEHALGDSRQRLPRAAGDQRDESALMICVERPGFEAVAHLLRELAIRLERRIEFPVDLADHAVARAFRDALRQQAFDLRFDRVEDVVDRGGVGRVEEFDLGSARTGGSSLRSFGV